MTDDGGGTAAAGPAAAATVALDGKVVVARGFWRRLVGLMGRSPSSMGRDECFVIPRCGAIHTWFMRFPIDVVFTDPRGKVLRVVGSMAPYRAAVVPGAAVVVEMPAGRAGFMGVRPGSSLALPEARGRP